MNPRLLLSTSPEYVILSRYRHRPALHSFPTRRSSDLPDLPDNPVLEAAALQDVPAGRVRSARSLARIYDMDQDDVVDLYAHLRARLPRTRTGEEPFLLGETVLADPDRVERYIQPGRLDAAMWFGTDRVP